MAATAFALQLLERLLTRTWNVLGHVNVVVCDGRNMLLNLVFSAEFEVELDGRWLVCHAVGVCSDELARERVDACFDEFQLARADKVVQFCNFDCHFEVVEDVVVFRGEHGLILRTIIRWKKQKATAYIIEQHSMLRKFVLSLSIFLTSQKQN